MGTSSPLVHTGVDEPPRCNRHLPCTDGALALGTTVEYLLAGTADGSFIWYLAPVATGPSSLGLLMGYSAILTASGVPLADHDVGLWSLAAFAACALVNASLLWVVFRGRRIAADQREPE